MKLKNLLLSGMMLGSFYTTKAQTVQADSSTQVVQTLQQTSAESTANEIAIDNLYAGSYVIGTMDERTLQKGTSASFGSVRVGGAGHRNIGKKVTMNGLVAYDQTSGQDGFFIGTYGVDYKPTETTTVGIGKLPIAATHMVAPPVTPAGHFLFTAESQVPVGAFTAKVTQAIGEGSVIGSFSLRNGDKEVSAYGETGPLHVAIVTNLDEKTWGGGASWIQEFTDKSSLYSMAWLDPEALSFSAMRTHKSGMTLLSDVGFFIDGKYNLDTKKLNHTQIGLLKNLSSGQSLCKIGVGYDVVKKKAQAVLFVTLKK